MKKILIVNNNMKVGGIQKSLYNLLWTLAEECAGEYELTLCLFDKMGEYADKLPPEVKIITTASPFKYLGISQGECRGAAGLARGILAATAKLFGRPAAISLMKAFTPMLEGEYDVAISFMQNGNIKNFYGGTNEFVLERTRAARRVAFLHCDYKQSGANSPKNNALYPRFDAVAACSDGCRRSFCEVMPELSERCHTVRNAHRYAVIRELSREDTVSYDGDINFLWVGRLAHEKAADRAIRALAEALKVISDKRVTLHIVGGGPKAEELSALSLELGLGGSVRFYGEQANPYRFMVNADMLVMSSYHEAAPMVIDEAAALGLPVLTVRTTSSDDMVTARGIGYVCENTDEALSAALTRALAGIEELRALKSRLREIDASAQNTEAIEQFKTVIGE